MPNCFTLTRKSDPKAGPVKLHIIDEELCGVLNERVDEEKWCHDWYNWIGFQLAMGKSFQWIRADFQEIAGVCALAGEEEDDSQELLTIINYLDANYTTDAFAYIGRS